MQHSFLLIVILLGLSAAAYQLGRRRSVVMGRQLGSVRKLHSLPSYYGYYTALWCSLPALLLFLLWLAFQDTIIIQLVTHDLPPEVRSLPTGELNLVINDIKNLASGDFVSHQADPAMQAAAAHYNSLQQTAAAALFVVVLVLAVSGAGLGWRYISPQLRARNWVEGAIKFFFISCSTVAIFTTVGIVLSVLF